MTAPTEHNSHLAGDLNAPQHQPTLLEQAQMQPDELEAIVPHTPAHRYIRDQRVANAATRKAFEVIAKWLDEQGEERSERKMGDSGTYFMIASEIRTSLRKAKR